MLQLQTQCAQQGPGNRAQLAPDAVSHSMSCYSVPASASHAQQETHASVLNRYCCCCLFADMLVNEYQTSPQLAGMSMPELQNHMSHLRHLTFKRLTEQMPGRKSAPGTATGPSSGVEAAAAGAGTSAGNQAFGGSVELGHITAGATGGSGAASGRTSRNRDAVQPFDQSNFSTLPL